MNKRVVIWIALVAGLVSLPLAVSFAAKCKLPPFLGSSAPPLVELVLERDHRLYYEAYNDASDLNGDDIPDVGYNNSITYFGYYDPKVCYTYNTTGQDKFVPSDNSTTKQCLGKTGRWSGNFLNYIGTSRMDVLRRVLYGGKRTVDTSGNTIISAAYIPHDAHSWGKEYKGSDIDQYTPLSAPSSGKQHLFCITSKTAGAIPKIRIRKDQNATTQRIWNWASKESPVCDGTADEEYTLSVQTCNNNFPIDSRFCRPYKDSGVTYYKPSGLLQNYMESDGNKTCSLVGNKACNTDSDCNFATEGICVDKAQMFMGLFTGTYTKNLSGGVLRKNIYGIYDEIQQNGILQSAESDQGNIIITLDRMEVIGYDYTSNFYKNSSQTGNCEWMVDRPLSQGECVMWGNPIGEMMYEGMRYFAEKTAATSAFTQGTTNDLTLALHEQEWGIKKSSTHYALSKIYPACSKRFMLVISDVNNNFDSDQVPDPNFGSFTGDLTGFSAKTLQSTIGKSEGLNGTTAFIGQYGNNTDFLCSAKSIGDLGYARGLCPEEPTKQGSYTPAAAAYYGHKLMMEKTGKMNVDTLAVALASPIPDVKMKLKGKDVRLAPAGKTVSGTYWYGDPYAACAKQRNLSRRTMPGGALAGNNTNGTLVIGNCTSGFPNCRTTSYCPSNTIVDFYIEKLPDPGNATQRMVFRVNFEDVEQGADHDMDAIVKYTVVGDNNTGTLKVSLDSSATGCGAAKCASGGYDEVLGFVISGTGNGTANTDGAWLVVRDDDVPGTNSTTTPKVISSLPKKWSRTFQVKGGAAGVMKDPLWYAAKWGGFADYNHNKKPDLDPEWDRTGGGQNGTEPDGDPDNYFFVANPLKLYDQLNAAFAMALAKKGSAGAVATVTQEINQGDVLVRAAFESFDEALSTTQLSWKGHLESYVPYAGCSLYGSSVDCKAISGCKWDNSTSTCSGTIYSFQADNVTFCKDRGVDPHCMDCGVKLEDQSYSSGRNIVTLIKDQLVPFQTGNTDLNTALAVTTDTDANKVINSTDTNNMIDWVRGKDDATQFKGLHNRFGWKLGDIIYSTPVVVSPPSVAAVPRYLAGTGFATFLDTWKHRDQMVYVGANDGMLHSFVLGRWDNGTKQWVFPAGNSTDDTWGLGVERWAYIPNNSLSELQDTAKGTYGTDTCPHRFVVDLSPQAWDIKRPSGWRTVLVGGERGGGDSYFAFDVTNPGNGTAAGNVTKLWEFSTLKNYPYADNVTTYKANYTKMKWLPMAYSLPYVGRLRDPAKGSPYVAFFGGGLHDLSFKASDADETAVLKALGANNTTTGYGKLKYLYYPTFHAVSLSDSNGNGTDLWKDIWKRLLNDTDYTNRYPLSTTITQPLASYAVSNVAAYDLFDSTGRSVTTGGKPDTFSDLLYGGDMNGTVYTLILDSAGANASVSVTPSCMVTRKTKKIPAGNPNAFRGARQPMTVTPVGALDKDGNLRVFFGTGKFDDMPADGADTAKMTFYALVEDLKEHLYTGTGSDNTTRCSSGIESVPVSDFRFTHKCQEDNTTRTYYWTKLNAQNVSMPDGGACFPCMFDLPHVGERVIDSALVAGGYVFFTTFVPKSDYCSSGGDAYLYVLDYMCRPLTTNPVLEGGGVSLQFLNTQTQSWSSTKGKFVGAVQVSIGSGMPSRPVLDSSGTSVFVQTSDARMVRINVDLGPGGRSKVNGWTRVVE